MRLLVVSSPPVSHALPPSTNTPHKAPDTASVRPVAPSGPDCLEAVDRASDRKAGGRRRCPGRQMPAESLASSDFFPAEFPLANRDWFECRQLTPLMLKELADIPGKEMLMITVDYPPGAVDPIHRHDAHAFVYVLQGSIVMQVRGGKEVSLVPGQTFYEGPNDVHTVGRNASTTEPAKFIVILLKKKGVDVVLPAE